MDELGVNNVPRISASETASSSASGRSAIHTKTHTHLFIYINMNKHIYICRERGRTFFVEGDFFDDIGFIEKELVIIVFFFVV
jgi:hypothetical protein